MVVLCEGELGSSCHPTCVHFTRILDTDSSETPEPNHSQHFFHMEIFVFVSKITGVS
jgi:hypothetical protein